MADGKVEHRPLYSERKRASMCAQCGPNLGAIARIIDHHLFIEPCRACGGHSRAFLEETAEA